MYYVCSQKREVEWFEWCIFRRVGKNKSWNNYFIYLYHDLYIPTRAAATKIKFLQNLLNLKQKQNGHAIFLFKFLRESKEER